MFKLITYCLDCFRKYQRRPFQRTGAGPPPRTYTFHSTDICAETIKESQTTVAGIILLALWEHIAVVRKQFDTRSQMVFGLVCLRTGKVQSWGLRRLRGLHSFVNSLILLVISWRPGK
jgi:hypothetical protein